MPRAGWTGAMWAESTAAAQQGQAGAGGVGLVSLQLFCTSCPPLVVSCSASSFLLHIVHILASSAGVLLSSSPVPLLAFWLVFELSGGCRRIASLAWLLLRLLCVWDRPTHVSFHCP